MCIRDRLKPTGGEISFNCKPSLGYLPQYSTIDRKFPISVELSLIHIFYNPATGKSIYLDAGDPTDRYFTNISWAPDEKSLYLIEVCLLYTSRCV